jgi:hypothetical protein
MTSGLRVAMLVLVVVIVIVAMTRGSSFVCYSTGRAVD